MFVNSLFKDFLEENGLKHNGESTRDLICLEFNYGSRSYPKEMEHLKKVATTARKEYRIASCKRDNYLISKSDNKRKKISELTKIAIGNKSLYTELSKKDLRTLFYNEGIDIKYITRFKNGNIKKVEKIHYKMLFRSTGKAKKGSCMFIRDKLYKKAIKFLYMGIKLPKNNAPIVEVSAYAPLISSGIVGKVKINPKNILVLKDVDRFFETNIVSIETDEQKRCIANYKKNCKLKNTLFDGQALIDSSIFPSWGSGYILLRHHFCKMAAFSTNIQKFFKDYFGDDYYSATVKDMWGNEHFVKDVELITTDNAMKWIKFDTSYDYWCDRVYENGCQFGIVKTAHPSKLGNVQKMSYQMVNSLSLDIMENVCKKTVDYIDLLKSDDCVFMDYLKKNGNFSNDYEALIYLCDNNREFIRSKYFRTRRSDIIKNYLLNVKSGKIINDGDNLTIVGSPYAMLLYAATGDESIVDTDETFCTEDGTIQCYTERFGDGEYLAGFRSPFNGKYNLSYLHNVHNELFKKYFNFGKQIIAVNMNGTDFQDRNNGSDQDSDFLYTTNQVDIVNHAKYCYETYPTIVNNISMDKNTYNNTMDDFARLDNLLSASQTDIGESSNLAQIAQTYSYSEEHKEDDENQKQFNKYDNYVAILSVLAQIAIDSAKRLFDVDVSKNISDIKKDMNVNEKKYPKFWLLIKKGFNKQNINDSLKCPMNYLCDLETKQVHPNKSTLPMDYFFNKYELSTGRKICKKVEELITRYSFDLSKSHDCDDSDYILLRSDFEKMIYDISATSISSNYLGLFSWLIDRAFLFTPQVKGKINIMESELRKNKSLLLKTLYCVNKKNLLKVFSKNIKK